MPLKRRAPSLSFSEAYSAAQSFLVHIGMAPDTVNEPADGIVEMSGEGYTSRLRYDDAPVGQGAILALLKQTEESGDAAILFSASGYTGSAEVFAGNLNVALFEVDRHGGIGPRSPAAHQRMPAEAFEPPFLPSDPNALDADRPPGAWMPGQGDGIADHEWLDCAVCGTTHHPEANFCHRCGAQLSRKHRIDPTGRRDQPGGAGSLPSEARRKSKARQRSRPRSMRCTVCGSTEIEVVDD